MATGPTAAPPDPRDGRPQGQGLADRTTLAALAAAALLVAVAVIGGLAAAALVQQSAPAVRPSPATAAPTATPTATQSDDDLWRHPLAAGCATADAVWVVSDGGGIGRYDGERWSFVDRSLRSLSSAACARNTMLAVGGAGRVVTADDTARTVRIDTTGLEDLNAVAILRDGSMAVGQRGIVLRQVAAGWGPYARGLEEDLFGLAAFSASSAWAVGAGGATYRLEEAGWRPVPSGVTATLRAVAGESAGDVVAVGDAGTVLRFDGRWQRVESGFAGTFRAAAQAAGRTWIGGDGGAVYTVSASGAERRSIGTSCTIRGIFGRGDEVWFVGSDGTFAGVWRLAGDRLERWGMC